MIFHLFSSKNYSIQKWFNEESYDYWTLESWRNVLESKLWKAQEIYQYLQTEINSYVATTGRHTNLRDKKELQDEKVDIKKRAESLLKLILEKQEKSLDRLKTIENLLFFQKYQCTPQMAFDFHRKLVDLNKHFFASVMQSEGQTTVVRNKSKSRIQI